MNDKYKVQQLVGSVSGTLFFIIIFSRIIALMFTGQCIILDNLLLYTTFGLLTLIGAAISLAFYLMNKVQKGALFGIISFLCLLITYILLKVELNQFNIIYILLLFCTSGLGIGGFLPSFPSSTIPSAHSTNINHIKHSNITGEIYESSDTSHFKIADNDPRYIVCLHCGHENFCNYKFCQNCRREFIR